ncbi:hypothetical protein AeMF1_001448 [Aphanomyces euteiches]|nr:hypothetical protein AeMF1_001448 [Aphanomyces euteiches]
MKRRGSQPDSWPRNKGNAAFKFSKTEQAKRDFLRRLGCDLQRDDIPSQAFKSAYVLPKKQAGLIKTTALDFYSLLEVRSWGSGSHGQLGLGDDRHRPTPDIMLPIYKITNDPSRVQICCGDLVSAAINELGQVYVWGRLPLDASQNIRVPERVSGLDKVCIRQMDCGPGHMAFVSTDGYVFTWGKGASGRLGHGDEHNVYLPRSLTSPLAVSIRQVACGEEHTLLLTTSGTILSFGNGRAGQLGLGTYCNCSEPSLVPLDHVVVQIACGMNHSGAVSDGGEVFTWGWGEQGRLGHGSEEPQPSAKHVDGLRHVTTLSCGGAHSLALTKCQKVFAWGWGAFGQLGNGSCHDCLVPKAIKSLENVTAIACGYGHSAAVTDHGELYIWGFGEEGQTGTGDEKNHETPQRVISSDREGQILHVSLGKAHTMAVVLLKADTALRKRLSPENIRLAAITLQCFVRRTVARFKAHRLRCERQVHAKEKHNHDLKKLADEEGFEVERIAALERLDAERKLVEKAQAIEAQRRRELKIASATRIQSIVRRHLARHCVAKRLRQIRKVQAASERAEQEAQELATRLAVVEVEAEALAIDDIARLFLDDVVDAAEDMTLQVVEEQWLQLESAKQLKRREEMLLQQQKEEAQRRAALAEEREARRREAVEAAEAELKRRRDREIADAKAKRLARLQNQTSIPTPIPHVGETKYKRRGKEKKRDVEELNANRAKREKERAELAQQKRLMEEQLREKQQVAAKLESERHERLFRKSLQNSPTVRPNAAFHVRATYIAETSTSYRGELKPHYVLDPAAPSTDIGKDVQRVPTASKYRIFRELQRGAITNDRTYRVSKSSDGKRPSNQLCLPLYRDAAAMPKFSLPKIHRRYYTPEEVSMHKCSEDCWVVVFSHVLDITDLIAKNRGMLTQPLVNHAGEDISHWFDPDTMDVKTHIDPDRNLRLPYLPHGRFLHVPPPEPVTTWNTLDLKPWWTDDQYFIGFITQRVRMIEVVNTLTHQKHSLQVCTEETIEEIQYRYIDLQFNAHAASYTWKYLDGDEFVPLDMAKTLTENGIPDESLEFEKLNMDADEFMPILHLYYNDDLTIM